MKQKNVGLEPSETQRMLFGCVFMLVMAAPLVAGAILQSIYDNLRWLLAGIVVFLLMLLACEIIARRSPAPWHRRYKR